MGVNHIGLILDGNRRYARRRNEHPTKGHFHGAKTLERLFEWYAGLEGEEKANYDFKELSLYAFSMQNFSRGNFEKKLLMDLFASSFLKLVKSKHLRNLDIQVNFIGRIYLLPERVQKAIIETEEKTKHNSSRRLNICIAYGGREEIVDGINKLLKEGRKSITEEEFSQYLHMSNEPDLIIRTGGANRTSNFLPWQSTYSEWFFLEKTWPEFTPDDLKQVIDDFQGQERRFGK